MEGLQWCTPQTRALRCGRRRSSATAARIVPLPVCSAICSECDTHAAPCAYTTAAPRNRACAARYGHVRAQGMWARPGPPACCNTVHDVATRCTMLQLGAQCCNTVHDVATRCMLLQLGARCCNTVHDVATQVVHRLDTDTSGVIAFAKTFDALSALQVCGHVRPRAPTHRPHASTHEYPHTCTRAPSA